MIAVVGMFVVVEVVVVGLASAAILTMVGGVFTKKEESLSCLVGCSSAIPLGWCLLICMVCVRGMQGEESDLKQSDLEVGFEAVGFGAVGIDETQSRRTKVWFKNRTL